MRPETAGNGCPTLLHFLGPAAVSRGRLALAAPGFFKVELGVGGGEELFDALAVPVVDGNANAGGKLGLFRVPGDDGADAVGDARGFFLQSFRQNECEFVSTVAGGGVDGSAVDAQDVR